MRKILLILLSLTGILTTVNAQSKTTYAEVYKSQTGWTVVISGNTIDDTETYDFIPKMSERLYVLPSNGKLFDTHIYAINYMAKNYGFEVVEAYQLDGHTRFLLESDDIVTIKVTSDWETNKYITVNK
jgi:hypothetical protein